MAAFAACWSGGNGIRSLVGDSAANSASSVQMASPGPLLQRFQVVDAVASGALVEAPVCLIAVASWMLLRRLHAISGRARSSPKAMQAARRSGSSWIASKVRSGWQRLAGAGCTVRAGVVVRHASSGQDLEEVTKAAEAGDPESQYLLGKMCINGDGVPQDTGKAMEWLEKAAQKNFPPAQFNLGMMLMSGEEGIPELPAKGAELLQKAAYGGEPMAQYFLGRLFYEGSVVEKDLDQALDLMTSAAKAGIREAQYTAGSMLLETPPEAEEEKEWAAHWLNKAAEQNDARAQLAIGRMQLLGIGMEPSATKAAEWVSSAANNGYAEAEYLMSALLLSGTGVDENSEWATYWLEKAAEQGQPEAVKTLEYLKDTNTPEKGKAYAQFYLGMMSLQEEGMRDDAKQEAKDYIELAALKGCVDAQYVLGTMLLLNTPKDATEAKEEAAKWFNAAAAQGDPRSKLLIGKMFMNGMGVEKDAAKAAEWMSAAANDGVVEAQYLMGTMLLSGTGVELNQSWAAYWFEQAAGQGYVDAQYNLALMLEAGDGIPEDKAKADFWYKKAAAQGDVESAQIAARG